MAQIDLDDLPPKIAGVLAGLAPGEELVLVRGGLVVARLDARVAARAKPEEGDAAEPQMEEVLEQFNAMIHDEF